MTKLIVGCGYLGRRVAAAWLAEGHRVFALTRSATKADELRKAGIHPIVADLVVKSSLEKLPAVETVFHAVGFDRSPGQSIEQVYVSGLANVLRAVNQDALHKFFFISSTGVYGQIDEQWVDERSECLPSRPGGRACLDAENTLRAHPLGNSAIILRLAGLYGPGRIPRLPELSRGGTLNVPTKGFLNLIHVDDVVRVVLAAEQRVASPELFVVADGHPVPRIEYYRELARLLGAPAPRFGSPSEQTSAANRAAASNKRICNRRLLDHLQFQFKYPSFRQGLSAIIGQETTNDK